MVQLSSWSQDAVSSLNTTYGRSQLVLEVLNELIAAQAVQQQATSEVGGLFNSLLTAMNIFINITDYTTGIITDGLGIDASNATAEDLALLMCMVKRVPLTKVEFGVYRKSAVPRALNSTMGTGSSNSTGQGWLR